MNRNECWMAACVTALVVGVSVGQAQEKPAKPQPTPAPKVFYIPPVPFDHPLALELVGLEAVGCKVCASAIQTDDANCKSCAGCAECAQAKTGGCCTECVKSNTAVFASDCDGSCAPLKKAKKRKAGDLRDYFQIAVPPPCMPMPPQGIPVAIYASPAVGRCPVSVPLPMPTPAEPMMVFRAASHANASACGSCGCNSGVQQAKHDTGGKIGIAVSLGLTHAVPQVQVATAGHLEIECGGQCKASCEKMTIHMPGGKELTIAPMGKQVVVSGPALSATCDTLARSECNGSLCLVLEGHVHLHHGKAGMKADVESEQVRLVLHGDVVEVHTVTSP
jgi:hypothetical protein